MKLENWEIRFFRTLLIGLLPSFLLAVVYVYFGMPLLESPLYPKINQYAFAIAIAISITTLPLGYYWRYGDITETLALISWIIYGFASFIEDIFVYIVCIPTGKCGFRWFLPWLTDSIAGQISLALGFPEMHSLVLIGWVLSTGVLTGLWTIFLFKLEIDDRIKKEFF